MRSLSYHIIQLIILLKGVKKTFSGNPVNYKRLRKKNIQFPSSKLIYGLKTNVLFIENIRVTELSPNEIISNEIIFYCPGGSFVFGPNDFNWKSLAYMVKHTGRKGYMIDYPKAPENTIVEMNNAIDAIYFYFLNQNNHSEILLLGGSVGGTLVTLLYQRLLKNQKTLPKKMILITPIMDCSLSNVNINSLEKKDIMNSKIGLLSCHSICADIMELKNECISPLYGLKKILNPTLLFIAENDITRPDTELFISEIKTDTIIEVEYGIGMPHIYPLLPIKEGKQALDKIVKFINQ